MTCTILGALPTSIGMLQLNMSSEPPDGMLYGGVGRNQNVILEIPHFNTF